MAKFIINGGKKLSGSVQLSGAKNAVLKMLAATVLTKKICTLNNVPRVADVMIMIKILENIGAKTKWLNQNSLEVDSANINSCQPDPDLMRKMRASVVLAGPLLARFGKTEIAEPGGCVIGARPVYIHWKAFQKIGVKVTESVSSVRLESPEKFLDKKIILDQMSVTATENILMLAAGISVKTEIHLAACEPEIQNLIAMLKIMGAKIKGVGTHELIVEGSNKLQGVKIDVIPDRIEAGTFAIAGIITNGNITVEKIIPGHMEMFLNKLQAAGVNFRLKNPRDNFADLEIQSNHNLHAIKIDTRTYPGYPTDLQAPISVLLTQCPLTSKIFETMFENRLKYLEELQKMGAKIKILNEHEAEISGPTKLHGAQITSFDLRAGATLILAGLIADGQTEISNIETIDRGYERIECKLQKLGANIERIN